MLAYWIQSIVGELEGCGFFFKSIFMFIKFKYFLKPSINSKTEIFTLNPFSTNLKLSFWLTTSKLRIVCKNNFVDKS